MSRALRTLMDEQREWLQGLDQEAQAQVRALVEAAEQDLAARLAEAVGRLPGDSFTRTQLSQLSLQARAAADTLTQALGQDLRARASAWGKAGLGHILDQVELMEGALGTLRLDLALGLRGSSGLRTASALERYGQALVEKFETRLSLALATQLPRQEAVGRIQAAGGKAFESLRSRAALIHRNELTGVYDRDAEQGLTRLNESLVGRGRPGLLMRMDEARDRRSCPFSLVAHGQVAAVGGAWEVPVAEVEALAGRLRQSNGGVVWPVVGSYWVGDGYIAHHNDRGRRTAWRDSWGDPRRT